jgi:hypothetical protein
MTLDTKIAIASLVVSALSVLLMLLGGAIAYGVFYGEFKQIKKQVNLLVEIHLRGADVPQHMQHENGADLLEYLLEHEHERKAFREARSQKAEGRT